MPKRTDISSILVIGAGPIVIGQACEFDYSGTQAIKALKEDGVFTVLLNPNIATIQTSEGMADRLYLLAVTPEIAAEVMRKEIAMLKKLALAKEQSEEYLAESLSRVRSDYLLMPAQLVQQGGQNLFFLPRDFSRKSWSRSASCGSSSMATFSSFIASFFTSSGIPAASIFCRNSSTT